MRIFHARRQKKHEVGGHCQGNLQGQQKAVAPAPAPQPGQGPQRHHHDAELCDIDPFADIERAAAGDNTQGMAAGHRCQEDKSGGKDISTRPVFPPWRACPVKPITNKSNGTTTLAVQPIQANHVPAPGPAG